LRFSSDFRSPLIVSVFPTTEMSVYARQVRMKDELVIFFVQFHGRVEKTADPVSVFAMRRGGEKLVHVLLQVCEQLERIHPPVFVFDHGIHGCASLSFKSLNLLYKNQFLCQFV